MCTRPWFIVVFAACAPDPAPVSTAAPNGQMALGAWLAVRPLLTQVWTAESDTESATFGDSVAAAGDVNGDGYGDVIVGGRDYANGESGEGGAFLYLGSAAGLETTAGWSVESKEPGAALVASDT